MTKQELVREVAYNTGISLQAAAKTVNAVLDPIISRLKHGDEVQIKDFGIFTLQQVEQRTARNPRTGEPVIVAAHKNVRFKAAKCIRDAINRK